MTDLARRLYETVRKQTDWVDPAPLSLKTVQIDGFVDFDELADVANRWRPIETAPKDGSGILAYGRHTGSPPGAARGVKAGDHWWAIIQWDIWRAPENGGQRWVFCKDGTPAWSEPMQWQLLEPPS